MHRIKTLFKNFVEYILPWLVLALLLGLTYARFFRHAYGIAWNTDGVVSRVYVNELEPTIHEGDRLVQVGDVLFESFRNDLSRVLFASSTPGDVLPVVVERNGQLMTVQWRMPGPNTAEMRDQLATPWLLAYFLWAAGTASLLLVRPRDVRWLLLGAFNFLTAIWVSAGIGLSTSHIWYSAFGLRVTVWIWLPVCLHLHWIFPKPLGKLPGWLPGFIYGLCAAVAVAQCFQVIPARLYTGAFLAALLGSGTLLAAHAERQPEMRRDLRMLALAALLALMPLAVLATIGGLGGRLPRIANLAIFSFPILPFAYLYAAYRRQLGGMELRVNRVISIYTFVILLGMIVVPVLVALYALPRYSADQPLVISVIASTVVTALSLWTFPKFQSFVEQRMLGIAVPSRELQQTYSAHLTSSSSFTELTRLLEQEILPSLLVRQFVFLLLDNGTARVLVNYGVRADRIPGEDAVALLAPLAGRYPARGLLGDKRYAWIRLVLPLKVQDELAGYWLFGRRDPDDSYLSAEIPVLQLFANQTAIALSNILQSERLRAMYQADINRHEKERLSLARDLHDSVLSALAGMLISSDIASLPKGFQEGYHTLTQRLREIVSDLRPPMLSYGLKPAIEELADNLTERGRDSINIQVDIESAGERFPIDQEQHLFRIAQEACENAVRHSHCKNIAISGRLEAGCVELSISDDGDGFELTKESTQLYDLLGHRHFGLAGMLERAAVIDADIRINSAPGAGTQVLVKWRASPAQAVPDQGAGDSSA